MVIQKIIPNPFDKDSTLSGLEKKAELIKEGLTFANTIKLILFLIVLGIFLIFYFKINALIVAIFIGSQILSASISSYLRAKELKAISSIDTKNNAESYRNLLITNEYWELRKSLVGAVISVISVALIFIFFFSEISNFISQEMPINLPSQLNVLKYFLFVFVFFRVFEFIVKLVRYNAIKNLKENNDFAQVHQEYLLIENKLKLIEFFPKTSLILLAFFLIGIPLWIILIFAGFILLTVLVAIIELNRIKKVKFNQDGIDSSIIQHKILQYKGEKIVGAIFGIMKIATSFMDMFKPRGSIIVGAGKIYFPENSLFITNNRLLLAQIPVTGGNKIVGNIDYVSRNFFFNRKEIRQKGEKILKEDSLKKIIALTINDVLYKDIKKLTLDQSKIIIEKFSGEKLGYTFMDREYIEPLRKLLGFYLKERFVEKE